MTIQITPLLQAQLTAQIQKIREAIDNGFYALAFECCETLVNMMNPKHTKELYQEHIYPIKQEFKRVVRDTRSDQHINVKIKRRNVENLFRNHIRGTFIAIMEILYEKGYMEESRTEVPRGRELPTAT